MHVGCQIDIMCQNLTYAFPKNENKLKFFIGRYQEIIAFAEKIEKLFTYIALSQLISNTVSTCCEGFLIVLVSNDYSLCAYDTLLFHCVVYEMNITGCKRSEWTCCTDQMCFILYSYLLRSFHILFRWGISSH